MDHKLSHNLDGYKSLMESNKMLKNNQSFEKGRHERPLKVYSHSDFIYWWVVWVWGFACAFLTKVQGLPVSLNGGKAVLVHPSVLRLTLSTRF